jgi:soluble epoxide hydrolase / lipid-phosphate phosphatase
LQERAIQSQLLLQGGFAAPLNWYKIVRGNLEGQDDKGAIYLSLSSLLFKCNDLNHESPFTGIPPENAFIQKPVFFGAALRDYVAVAPIFIQSAIAFSNSSLTIHEYDSSHWVLLESKDEVNSDLLQWIEGLTLDG